MNILVSSELAHSDNISKREKIKWMNISDRSGTLHVFLGEGTHSDNIYKNKIKLMNISDRSVTLEVFFRRGYIFSKILSIGT
jgi:hypothetical protein